MSLNCSTKEGINNAIRINFRRENQFLFEVFKRVNDENEVKCKWEKEMIKHMLHKVEVNQRRIFIGIENGAGKNENNVPLEMNGDRTD